MSQVTPGFFTNVEDGIRHMLKLTVKLDAKCTLGIEHHIDVGRFGETVRCDSCSGTDRNPIPTREVIQSDDY